MMNTQNQTLIVSILIIFVFLVAMANESEAFLVVETLKVGVSRALYALKMSVEMKLTQTVTKCKIFLKKSQKQ